MVTPVAGTFAKETDNEGLRFVPLIVTMLPPAIGPKFGVIVKVPGAWYT